MLLGLIELGIFSLLGAGAFTTVLLFRLRSRNNYEED